MAIQTFSGSRLRDLRTARKLTQHDLASGLRRRGFGTTQTTVSRWEDGQQPNARVLPALAAELGCSIVELYGDDDEEDEEEEESAMPQHRDLIEALHHALGVALGKTGAAA